MRRYDPKEALVFSHVPKTAGSSVMVVFEQWFKKGFIKLHRVRDDDIVEFEIPEFDAATRPILISEHFSRARGIGMEDVLPGITQTVMIFRDPWERAISGYFYRKKRSKLNPRFSWIDSITLADYLSGYPYDDPLYGPPMSNFTPRPCTMENYRDVLNHWCVAVGTTERLTETLAHFARVLGFDFDPSTLPHVNAAVRMTPIPKHLREDFISRNALDYALHDFADRQISDG